MNKHTKVTCFLLPLLLLFGFNVMAQNDFIGGRHPSRIIKIVKESF